MKEAALSKFQQAMRKRWGRMLPAPWAAAFLPAYVCLRLLKSTLGKAMYAYESKWAPLLALRACFLIWPTYKLLKSMNICFIFHMGGGVGHTLAELDHFLRRKELGELDRNKKYIWIRKNEEFAFVCMKLYGHHFYWVKCSTALYLALLPLCIRWKDLTHDVGLSRLKWQFASSNCRQKPPSGQTYLHQITKEEGIIQWIDYYKRCKKTKHSLLNYTYIKNQKLEEWLQGVKDVRKTSENEEVKSKNPIKNIVLLHVKDCIKNASAAPTDPRTYCPAIHYIHSLGYQTIFVGREPMPELFAECNVLNYAQSPLASFKNDMDLFLLAKFAITAGSGVAFLADLFDRPYLYVNSWQLPMAMFSPKCIAVPALVRKKEGAFLSFLDQMHLYRSLPDHGDEIFPEKGFVPRNATGEDILRGVKELIALIQFPTPPSKLQERFRTLDQNTPLYYARSRVSHSFLKEHKDLFS